MQALDVPNVYNLVDMYLLPLELRTLSLAVTSFLWILKVQEIHDYEPIFS